MNWLIYASLTVIFWGMYGVLLHMGVQGYQPKEDPTARYKAFLFVGVAYCLIAVLAPLTVMWVQGKTGGLWSRGWSAPTWSLAAGIAGAAGAFFVLMAFGAAPKPTERYVPVVMSIIFAGAPLVNAVAAMLMHPPKNMIDWRFGLGILLAAFGGMLITFYKPT